MLGRGQAPELVDVYEDVMLQAHADYPATRQWLSLDWQASAANLCGQGQNQFEIAWAITLPPLWSAILQNCGDRPNLLIPTLAKAERLVEMPIDQLAATLDRYKEQFPKETEIALARLGEVPAYRDRLGIGNVSALPTAIARSEWDGAPSYVSDMEEIESLVEINEMLDAELIHHIDHIKVAESGGRIFRSPKLAELPPGSYTFVFFSDGSTTFGQDAHRIEVGTKHFQLAQGRPVVAAGEYRDGQFSLMSGGFSRKLLKLDGYSERATAEKVSAIFSKSLGRPVQFSKTPLWEEPEFIPLAIVRVYCAEPSFRRRHKESICREWNPEEVGCAAVVAH